MRFGRSTRGQHGARTADHRIPAIAQPGGAGVVGLTGNLDPPPAVRPKPVANRDSTAEVDQAATLLDVQLENDPMRPRASGSGPRCSGLPPGPTHCLRHGHAVGVTQARALSGLSAPVITRDPAQETPNRAPSSSTKFTTPIGRRGAKPSERSRSMASNALTTPSGPSKAPPSGTLSRCDPVTTPPVGSYRDRPTRPTGCPSGPRSDPRPRPRTRRRTTSACSDRPRSRRSGGSRRWSDRARCLQSPTTAARTLIR